MRTPEHEYMSTEELISAFRETRETNQRLNRKIGEMEAPWARMVVDAHKAVEKGQKELLEAQRIISHQYRALQDAHKENYFLKCIKPVRQKMIANIIVGANVLTMFLSLIALAFHWFK